MNKQQASQIIQAYQDYRHGDDCIAYLYIKRLGIQLEKAISIK